MTKRSRRKVGAGFPVSAVTPLFPSPLISEKPDREGMYYAMLYPNRVIGAPSVAYTPRQSLGQMVTKYRTQNTHYFSRFRLGLQATIGYPTARGFKIINTAPPLSRRQLPNTSGRAAREPGAMNPPPRFTKALKTKQNPYKAPVYGE